MKKMPRYVVSGDIDVLLRKWCAKHGFQLPSKRFFDDLRTAMSSSLENIFGEVDIIPTSALLDSGLTIELGGVPIVTLDKVYVETPHEIELTRTVLSNLEDGPVVSRQGYPSLDRQIEVIRAKLGASDIIVYDDVIFSGHLLETVCSRLKVADMKVTQVVCGVGIQGGIDRLTKQGIEVQCAHSYASVIDQVCERDFYPGVDYSGRTLSAEKNIGVPYLLPFGKPALWASVPEECALGFSKFCIGQTVTLFREIEKLSGKPVFCADIDRKLRDLPLNGTRFVEYLTRKSNEIN